MLICSCGSKRYKDELLICHHPSHQPKQSNHKKEVSHPPVPDRREPPAEVLYSDNLISDIIQQLKKIQFRKGETTDPKILIAIINLQSTNNEEEIKSIMRILQNMNIDGDTEHLIHQYLNKSDN